MRILVDSAVQSRRLRKEAIDMEQLARSAVREEKRAHVTCNTNRKAIGIKYAVECDGAISLL